MFTIHFVEYGGVGDLLVEFVSGQQSEDVADAVIARLRNKGIDAYKRKVERDDCCAMCHRRPNGQSPDSVDFTICPTHAICNECRAKFQGRLKGCPVCQALGHVDSLLQQRRRGK